MGLNISMPKCGGKQGGREHGAGVRWFFTRCQGTQWGSKSQIPTPRPSGLWGVKGYSGDGAGDDRTCSLTVSEASWGCTASVSMVSRQRWERAQTFHMLQVGNTGGFVIDTASGLGGVTRWVDPGCRANLVSPTASLLLSGSTTHLSPTLYWPRLRFRAPQSLLMPSCPVPWGGMLLPRGGFGISGTSHHLPSSWQRGHGRGVV